ncbi:MAG: rod shape-determining protein MreC [Chlamydiales bacterium]
MRKGLTIPFLALIAFLFCWINLPLSISDRIRSLAAAPFALKSAEGQGEELSSLRLENRHLKLQLDHWTLALRGMAYLPEFSAVPAQVTYRDPSLWSSSLWVNVGEESHRVSGKKIIGKNSPVLADGALVGVVEYVGERQSRIRLITDSGLSPSVRVNRGGLQNRELASRIDALLKLIEKRGELFDTPQEKDRFLEQLDFLKKRAGADWEEGYLAKGEVHGSSAPFWRSRSPLLRGVGFHFDDPNEDWKGRSAPILKEGDLLVTSGLDGVFPQGIQVGIVSKVKPEKEGAYAYEIEVRPSANNLNDLQTVIILPPISE